MELPLQVVCAILRDGDKIAVFQRRASDCEVSDKWEFPGGKIEPGEEATAALIRELKEELSIDITVPRYVGVVDWQYPNLHLQLHAFEVSKWKGCIRLYVHQDYRWVPHANLGEVELADADRALVEKYGLI